jgi:hypothetical protein
MRRSPGNGQVVQADTARSRTSAQRDFIVNHGKSNKTTHPPRTNDEARQQPTNRKKSFLL